MSQYMGKTGIDAFSGHLSTFLDIFDAESRLGCYGITSTCLNRRVCSFFQKFNI